MKTGLKKSVTARNVVSLLNEALKLDPKCIEKLVSNRVRCNDSIAAHPTIQVHRYKKDKFYSVGIIGILNGIFGIRKDKMGAICVEFDDNDKLVKFRLPPKQS